MRWLPFLLLLLPTGTHCQVDSLQTVITDYLAENPVGSLDYGFDLLPVNKLIATCDIKSSCLDEQLSWLAVHNDTLLPAAFEEVSNHLRRQRMTPLARGYLQRGLAASSRLESTLWEGQFMLLLGYDYFSSGDHSDSTAHYLYGALEKFREVDSDRMGLALYQLGYMHRGLGMIDKAFEEFEAAYRIEAPTGIRSRYGNDLYSLISLALEYDRQDILDTYLPLYEEFRATSKFIDGKHDVILNLLRTDAEQFAALERYVSRYEREGDTTNVNPNHALSAYASGLKARGRYREAERYLRKSIAHSRYVGRDAVAASDYYQLYLLGKETENSDLIIEGLENYGTVRRRVLQSQYIDNISRLEVEFETQQARRELNETNLALERSRGQHRLLQAGGLALVFVGLLGWFFYRNQIRLRQLKTHLRREEQARARETLTRRGEAEKLRAEIEGEENERRRVAKDLNDGIGALLTTIKVHVDELAPGVSSSGRLIDRACTSLRRIAYNLMPQTLTLAGLQGSLEDLANQLRTQGFAVELDIEDTAVDFDLSSQTMLLRIVQELTHNASKHARATELRIGLRRRDGELELKVGDNGKGFNLAHAKKQGGLGLTSVEQRVIYLNGRSEFTSKPGWGTQITIRIPGQKEPAGRGGATALLTTGVLFLLLGSSISAQSDSLHHAIDNHWEVRDYRQLRTAMHELLKPCLDDPVRLKEELAFSRSLSDTMEFQYYLYLKQLHHMEQNSRGRRVALDSMLASSRRIGYGKGASIALSGFGDYYLQQGEGINLDSAASAAYSALDYLEPTDSVQMGLAYHVLAKVQLRIGAIDRGLATMEKSVTYTNPHNRPSYGFKLYHLLQYSMDYGRSEMFDRYFGTYLEFRKGAKSVDPAHDAVLMLFDGNRKAYDNLKRYLYDQPRLEGKLYMDYEYVHLLAAEEAIKHDELDDAKNFAERAITHAETNGRIGKLGNAYAIYAEIARRLDDVPTLIHALERNRSLEDSLSAIEYRESIGRLEVEYETERTRSALAEQQLTLEAVARQRNLYRVAGGGMLAALVLGGLFLFNRLQVRRFAHDTEELRRERELAEIARTAEMNSLSAMIEGQERERERVAKELHDGLGGLLTTVRHQISERQDSKEVVELIDRAATSVRRLAHNLMPKQNHYGGLSPGLEDIVAQLRTQAYEVDFSIVGNPDNKLDMKAAGMVLRIAQELTQNVVKHSGSEAIFLQLMESEDRLLLTVEDNGIGMDAFIATTGDPTTGLASVRQRVTLLGGELTIDAAPGRGTTVVVEIPVVSVP